MIKTIYSESAFDVVKSSNMPKAASTEAANKGATFQSYYSASDTREGAVSDVVRPEKANATDETPSALSTDAVDSSKSNGSEKDQERSVSRDADAAELVSVDAEGVPMRKTRPIVVSFSQGGGDNTDVANTSAANVNRNMGTEQPTHRSIAELRMTERQLSTGADRQPSQKLGQTPASVPQVELPTSNGIAAAEPKVETVTAAGNTGQSAAELQSNQQIIKPVDPRQAQVMQADTQSDSTGKAGIATDQNDAPSMTPTLQRMMTPSQGEQATLPVAVASRNTQTSATIHPVAQGTGRSANATSQVSEPEANMGDLDAEPTRDTIRRETERAPNTAPQVTTSATKTTVQVQPVTQTAAAGQVAVAEAEALVDPLAANLMLDPMGSEPAGLSQLLTEAVMSPGTTHRPETPRLVAAQMAEALATKGERNIDIALSPEELGRVKMRVSTTDSSVVVTITTERPETGDLMRRHINELSEEFRRMGFEDISFEFSGEGMSSEGNEQEDSLNNGSSRANNSGPNSENMQEPEQQNLRLGETGLDMRI